MNLSSLDLNLLVLLDALLEERNVTRGGARVGLSQPAASNALKRLRLILDDPLLEPDGRGLRLSERAHRLKGPLRKALNEVRTALDEPISFDPGTAKFKIQLFASDHIVFVLLPRLHERLRACAPGAELIIHWSQSDRVVDSLERGALDLAIGRYNNTPSGIRRAKLYDEVLVIQARRGHPALRDGLTPADFTLYPRIATSFDGRMFGDQEQAMARAGIEVTSTIVMPHLIAAPMLTLDSDLITIAPRRMAQRLSELIAVDWRPLPFDSAVVPIEMIWHERTVADPALAWFRGVVAEVGGDV